MERPACAGSDDTVSPCKCGGFPCETGLWRFMDGEGRRSKCVLGKDVRALFLNTDFLRNDEITLKLVKTADGDPEKGWVPAYHFAICSPAGERMGECDLRIGHNDLLYYGGNIGYRVEEPYRGHHYAGKACELLFGLAKKHGLGYVIITCNPDNYASRKTCEYAGGTLLEIVDLPEDNDMRQKGETQKCIYKFTL